VGPGDREDFAFVHQDGRFRLVADDQARFLRSPWSRPAKFQQAPQPFPHQKIMEDPRSVED